MARDQESSGDRDSLYVSWSKSKSQLPVVAIDLLHFDDMYQRQRLEDLILSYGVGTVFLQDGAYGEVSQWIASINQTSVVDPIFVVKARGVFGLPFGQLEGLPSDDWVVCWTDQTMIHQLAESNAALLHRMGVSVLQYDYFPSEYKTAEVEKALLYMKLMQEKGIHLSFGNSAAKFVTKHQSEIDWSKVVWLESGMLEKDALVKKKLRKKFDKVTGFEGLVMEDIATHSLSDNKKNQWDNGIQLLKMGNYSNHHSVLDELIESGIIKKSYFKQAVKAYYQQWHVLQSDRKAYPTPFDPLNPQMTYRYKVKAITLVKDLGDLFPIQDLKSNLFYSFSTSRHEEVFRQTMDRYTYNEHLPMSWLAYSPDSLMQILPRGSHLLVDLTGVVRREEVQTYVERLIHMSRYYQVGVVYQGVPSNLKYLEQLPVLLWSPDVSSEGMSFMVQMAFGGMDMSGALPAFLSATGQQAGVQKPSLHRLKYLDPKLLRVDETKLAQIDRLVEEAIRDEQFPGCQIMMVKDGAVVYNKSFGYLTYDSLEAVGWNHIYDIASVTKTVATVPMVMQEVSKGNLALEGRLGDYSDRFRETDKSNLRVGDLLMHQSGLRSYIPFWANAEYVKDSADFLYKKRVRRRKYEYSSVNWADSISTWIGTSTFNSLRNPDSTYRYLYSDLGFMIMKEVVEEKEHLSLDELADSLIYEPLAMNYTHYNPLRYFAEAQIAPTEQDDTFRGNLLRGQVHDRNAALLGGVSGHAGLFSNSNDLAKYMQMMMQSGTYGGHQFFDSTLVETFTEKINPDNLRAFGWDKPRHAVGNCSKYASEYAFGHSGFTGTVVWADPENGLIYIFLSNRIYPDPQNYKLIKNNTRTKIHDLMYEAILSQDKVVNHEM
ncbi:serine hydrolase [Reichenbachiella sp. 5M10]|uniref:serine hydrolase domain-containing protein n=1 Tax=Reichenbachiella sp. 5M10 TaxID=1889772 RepID=UPI001304799B|nr:serine hydrolase [Reichenbachiella sp. 5M10]